jgi:hypothetical protein
VGEWESGRVGEWESGRVGEWERNLIPPILPLPRSPTLPLFNYVVRRR